MKQLLKNIDRELLGSQLLFINQRDVIINHLKESIPALLECALDDFDLSSIDDSEHELSIELIVLDEIRRCASNKDLIGF